MRRLRPLFLALCLVLLSAPAALAAEGFDGGEGLMGETNDKIITTAGFIIIGGIPLFVLLMSILQHQLDKRKYRRMAAAKARAARADLRAGY